MDLFTWHIQIGIRLDSINYSFEKYLIPSGFSDQLSACLREKQMEVHHQK